VPLAIRKETGFKKSAAKILCVPSAHTQNIAPPQIHTQLRIAVSADLLFKMPDGYLKSYFPKGAAFPLTSKLMSFNEKGNPLVSLTVFSPSSNGTAARVQASLDEHGLKERTYGRIITGLYGKKANRVLARKKRKLNPYDLILSSNLGDVKTALSRGLSAAHVDASHPIQDNEKKTLRIALDFDRCSGIDYVKGEGEYFSVEGEEFAQRILRRTGDKDKALTEIWARDKALLDKPCHPGPLWPFLVKIIALRDALNKAPHLGKVEISLVTARQYESRQRVEETFKHWENQPDNLKSTHWSPKGPIVENLEADMFCDDSLHHIKSTQECSPSTLAGHTPWIPSHVSRLKRCYNKGMVL